MGGRSSGKFYLNEEGNGALVSDVEFVGNTEGNPSFLAKNPLNLMFKELCFFS